MEVPSKYQCDLFQPMDVAQAVTEEGVTNSSAFLQDDEGSVSSQTFAPWICFKDMKIRSVFFVVVAVV